MDASTTSARSDFLGAIVNFAVRYPGRTLAIVLGAQVVVWTLLPLLTSPNLELDLAEDLALGKEWQLGYWKHPPLPWWLADLFYRATGQVNSVYLLGPLTIAACFVGVYWLARDIAGPVQALIATLFLTGTHYYNYSAVKFAHDQMQLPFWVFTALFLYRGIVHGRAVDWLLAGAMLALAFWSKYAAFMLAASLALFLLIDPVARRTLSTRGPWLMALAFAIVIAPNIWWLVGNDFMPLKYVSGRARIAATAFEHLSLPARWLLIQAGAIGPTLALLAIVLFPRPAATRAAPQATAFARRYATLLAFGPAAVVVAIAVATGRSPIPMWGYPLWTFVPLAAVLWFGPVIDNLRQRFFTIGVIFFFLLGPAVWIGATIKHQTTRDRPKATEYPGRVLAERVTQEWRKATGSPLVYVAGTEFEVNNTAVYSADRPHVVVHGRPQLSPWIDMADLKKKGVLVLWEEGLPAAHVAEWRETFGATGEPGMFELTRQTRRPSRPLRFRYWIVPPAR